MHHADYDFEDRCHDRLIVEKLLSILPERNRRATRLWMCGRTHREIGEVVGSAGPPHSRTPAGEPISQERVRQLISGSLRKMYYQALRWRLIGALQRNERQRARRRPDLGPMPVPEDERRSKVELFVYDPVRMMSDRYVCTAYNGVPDERWKLVESRKVKMSRARKLAKLRSEQLRSSSLRSVKLRALR